MQTRQNSANIPAHYFNLQNYKKNPTPQYLSPINLRKCGIACEFWRLCGVCCDVFYVVYVVYVSVHQ